ncbi:MAG: DUF1592 domain-containing protein [Myxococcota bacterium]
MGAKTLLVALGGLLSACYSGLEVGPDALGPGAGVADGDDGGADGGEGDDDGDGGDGEPLGCADAPVEVGVTPLRRLTRAQYNATVADLLGDTSAPASVFVADELRAGFPSNESATGALQIDQYRQAAETLAATAAASRFGEWLACDVSTDACVLPFIESFGLRAYRRPLTTQERDDYLALVQSGRAQWGAERAVELAVQTMLMSPHFLYHVEVGEPAAVDAVTAPLTQWEIASRLSYFMWGTMPDDDLFDAARDGGLGTREEIEAEARRMLDDPRAADMLAEFGDHWLGLTHLDEVERDATAFPHWDPALLEAMRLETRTFLQEVVLRGDGSLETLLGANFSYLDPELAAHYGVTLGDDPLGKTELPAAERAGLLTQGSILVSHAYPSENSWVHRGKLVRERFLCGVMPPPPPEIEFENTNDPNRLENPQCRGCHELMDPIGQAFDSYDPTGHFVGGPAPGEVMGSDIGAFDTIPELGARLSEDEAARRCMAEQVGQFALSRRLWGADDCSREEIYATFEASGFNIRELLVATATSDAFRQLAKETVQ